MTMSVEESDGYDRVFSNIFIITFLLIKSDYHSQKEPLYMQ